MHVFLTGPVQIGKSTLIAAALDTLQPERLGGFRTVSAKPEADGSRPVYLHPAAAQDLLCGAQNRVGIRRPELGIASFPDAFETAGLAALEGAEDCDLILMDEIGRIYIMRLYNRLCSMIVTRNIEVPTKMCMEIRVSPIIPYSHCGTRIVRLTHYIRWYSRSVFPILLIRCWLFMSNKDVCRFGICMVRTRMK